MLDYQRLDVYQCAVRALNLSAQISDKIPKGYAMLSDQLRRASLSISLNIAEGCGRVSDRDAARFFSMARGSAMECAAVLDACSAVGVDQKEKMAEAMVLFERVVMMLTKMCR
jgi:four helix bundle protein